MSVEYQGYLEAPYLDQAYLADTNIVSTGLQFVRKISPNIDVVGLSWLQEPKTGKSLGVQVARYIVDKNAGTAVQYNARIYTGDSFGISFQRFMVAKSKQIRLQFARYIVNKQKLSAIQFRAGKLRHETSTEHGYLSGAYMFEPYLAPYMQVSLSTQYRAFITQPKKSGLQLNRKVAGNRESFGLSFKRIISGALDKFGFSFDQLQGRFLGMQFTQAIYNTVNLRILQDFPSRGVDGFNWVTNSAMGGDFGINNVNSDIIEQTWRSAFGVKSGLVISSDTGLPQGAFVDTIAILNHNLTTSASVVVQGSNDSDFASAPFSQTMYVIRENKNMFWISPELPNRSYRYWRFLINDGTNQADYLEIGTILYGSSLIMTEESFTDQVTKRTIHFSDKVRTEGYTNVSNDRAIKFAVALNFKNLNYGKGNYRKLTGVFQTARTSLKCLWIPTPKNPERFAVFGKLSEIPEEQHNYVAVDADYIDFSIQVDESL